MRLALYDPIWDRPCTACETWKYEPDGSIKRDYKGELVKRYGPTPCMSCPKPPVWAKATGKPIKELRVLGQESEMTEANRSAYEAYGRFKGVLAFPDDAIVQWYSGIIRSIEDRQKLNLSESLASGVDLVIEILCKRWGKR